MVCLQAKKRKEKGERKEQQLLGCEFGDEIRLKSK